MTSDKSALFQKFLDGRCSRSEVEQLLSHFQCQAGEEDMVHLIQQELDKPFISEEFHRAPGFDPTLQLESLRQRIQDAASTQTKRLRSRWIPYAAAAILIAASMVIWFFVDSDSPSTRSLETQTTRVSNDVAPGGNRAVLILDNGSTFNLSENQEGIIIGDNIRYEDGTSIFESDHTAPGAEISPQYATLSTPKGGTYHITLSDGTKVWLNAASTLRYPTKFSGTDRVVELDGEAYFSVVPNANRPTPFKVLSQGQEVEVLGTEFNVYAYPEEQTTKTTLLEGHVRVHLRSSNASNSYDLIPGQQATNEHSHVRVSEVDVNRYIAWKTGMFYFNQTPFEELMNQIERWYDVDVVYKSGIPKDTFGGKIRRDVSLLTVLELLKASEIDYYVDGNQLIIE